MKIAIVIATLVCVIPAGLAAQNAQVATSYDTTVGLDSRDDGILVQGQVTQNVSGGGVAEYVFHGIDEDDLVSSSSFTLYGSASHSIEPVVEQTLTFTLTNNNVTPGNATFAAVGHINFSVIGSTTSGPFTTDALVLWQNADGGLEGVSGFNRSVTEDTAETADFPIYTEWTTRDLEPGETLSFDVLLSATSSGGVQPEIGDVNLDGVINLLDVMPFIDVISTGAFQTEADINTDGTVNLLDVEPFVALLAGS